MKINCDACHASFQLDSKLINSEGSLVRCSKCQSIFRVYAPDTADRRQFPRTKTRNLIAHVSVDQNGKKVSQGMGKALDISKGGMLLETVNPIEAGQISLMAVDKDNNLLEIKAELIYCNETASGKYQVGIKFSGTERQVLNFVKKLIKEYNYRKHSMDMEMSI
jgi:predicted Zn finger-like uncharacterized protein